MFPIPQAALLLSAKHPCMGNPKEIRHSTERIAISAGYVPFDHIIVPYVAHLL